MLYLAYITTETTHSPGDDGMRGPYKQSFYRLVEANSIIEAERKVKTRYSQDKPYVIRVEVEISTPII